MNKLVLVCYSFDIKHLKLLLSEAKNCFEDSADYYGYHDINELFEHLNNSSKKDKIQIIILDLEQSNKTSLQFLEKVNQSAPNAVKLIISEATHLLNIQKQVTELDALHYLIRDYSPTGFKVALNHAKNYYPGLQLLIKNKSETPNEKVSPQLTALLNSNLVKEKLFSIIAHDLKSPFTALLGITELLISEWNGLSDQEKLDLVKGLNSTSESTHSLLENLLNWSKSQKESFKTLAEPFYVSGAIKSAIEITEVNAKQKGIEIINLVSEDLYINADENMISTVFRNLVSNAIKYIPENGRIKISYEAENNSHTFCVADNGNGISEQNIIDHFSPNQNKAKNNLDGFRGMGLLLCQDFIERNGGRIWLESKKGKGSKFYFTIPLATVFSTN